MPAPISDEKRRRFLRLVHQEGYSIAQAQRAVGVSYAWARKANKGFLTAAEFDRVQDAARNTDALEVLARPLRREELKAPAIRALDDFDLFRRRYLGRVTLPWHTQAAERIVEGIDSEHKEFMVLNAPPGGGKALALDTPLPTPTGWTTMKDVQVGDELLGADGRPCRVTFKSEVFYGHDCFEVRADDGASVIADANHLWPVRLHGEGQYKHTGRPDSPGKTGPKTRGVSGIRTQTTRFLSRRRSKRPQLAVTAPLDLPDVDLPVDPYVLGVWLGDGHSDGARITCHPDDASHYLSEFTKAGVLTSTTSTRDYTHIGLRRDHSICGRGHRRPAGQGCPECGAVGYRQRKYGETSPEPTQVGVHTWLRRLGLLHNKHVPDLYLRGSARQRLALLQGLVDTDGHVSSRGQTEFTSTNRRLADAVLFLARSLGVKASISEGRAMLDGRDCGAKYRVRFYHPQAARLPRKAERCRAGVRTPHRYLTVTPVESVPTQCIQVDSPDHLFLAGEGLLVTHNTTLLTDVCLWVTVRNRRIRGVYGSRVYNNAERVTRRMRRYLERTTPVQAKPEDVASGLAVDAEACLALDYGLFRPPTRIDLWRASEFIVAQDDDTPIDEKEPTWSAVGMDTGFLGNRYDLIVWDDLVDNTTIRTVDAIEAQRKWYDDEAESRLEPAGAMFLVGQRFAANDLYRFALDKKVPLDDDDGLDDTEIAELEAEQPSVYGHVKFVAHDDSKCEKDHGRDAPPQPQGCLLDPKRIPWRELNRLRANNPAKYAIQYQQEDANPEQALVKQIWVDGGVDRDTGIEHPGCWDPDRGLAELPTGLVAPFISFATADPSPTRYWGLQWWIYTPQAAQRLWLMDCLRVRMGGNDLLDWIADSQQFTGVMEDWQQRSIAAGFPIRTWIIEVNAAQRFLLQYDHVRRWRSAHNVNVLPHQTTLTKLDPKLGVDMVASWWVNGRIRLPKRGLHAAAASRHLVDEITRYPNAGTDDQVMAHWFAIHHLPRLTPAKDTPTVLRRPAAVLSINDYRGHNVAGRAG